MLNSMPPEMYWTGRRVKQRALQGMNVISSAAVWALFFFSVSFSPPPRLSPLFCSTSLRRFTQQCPSSGSSLCCNSNFVCIFNSYILILSVLFSLSDYQFIKCLHTTEIIRGIPGCVSIVNPSLHNYISIKNINFACVTGDREPLVFIESRASNNGEKKETEFFLCITCELFCCICSCENSTTGV